MVLILEQIMLKTDHHIYFSKLSQKTAKALDTTAHMDLINIPREVCHCFSFHQLQKA